ncbi:probable alpha,alpha-trehalose-phosphate synthase [UDP-forming] 11 [Cannabis sativa]|uniref:probable alpha,alpha-trehalose-phosphate synthase [UDP-forming] 11 n=1 Tax=Cannabis sativa TaxID=3483 RepID=UPI0029CA3457|nr:probable alpha,alpha-trehalose-phosphate synthase [UDP-forming] 11 [Cannabis sativa]
MLSGSSRLDQLNLLSIDDLWAMNRFPKLMSLPGVISPPSPSSEFENDEVSSPTSSGAVQERRIVVSNQLPIRARRNSETSKWSFELDKDSLVLQLKDGFGPQVEVIYVGCLEVEIDVSEQDEVSQILLENFRCVPTFLSPEIHNKFYHGFCKHYLWPLFHYMLPISPSQGASRFDKSQWRAYVSANKSFADKIMEVINPDEDFIWVHDYHLMILPTLLRKRFHRVKLGFFLHSPFPSSEIYRTLPVRNEILQALLNCDLIGFHTFDYARHFLSCCSRMLGLDYQSKRGYIGLEYYGRTVGIKILPVGIHMGQLQSVLSLSETAEKVKELREEYHGKIVVLGVDDMDLFKGISLKFLAMGQLLEEHPHLRGKVVLVQITNPARSQGKDVQDVENETNSIAEEINRKYGNENNGYKPIVFIKRQVTTLEKFAFYAIAECCVVNCVRDGMNLVPYKYTVCRQGSSVLDKAMGIVGVNDKPKESALIVSEFIGCSPSLSGAIRVNPWNIEAVSDALNWAICMPEMEKRLRHEKHYKYISSHDVAFWAKSFDQDLERACKDHYSKRCWGIGFGLGFRVVALGPNFRKLSLEHIMTAYKNTTNRLILLDYDGTIKSQASVNKAPSDIIISVLNHLCGDPKNVVFIASGRGRESLSEWFAPCEKLGISAEHGYFTRWNSGSSWETCSLAVDFDWKRIGLPVMELYTEATDGSFIEQKESALVWHHQDADPCFGSSQAKELLDHLESVLANEPVVVTRGQHIVEVKPQGVSKGRAVESLISALQSKGKAPDFVLCIGDDRSDEDMFESIYRSSSSNPASLPAIAEVFACTVGQKPSTAKYYLDDSTEVIKLLIGLASASALEPKINNASDSFEVIS